MTDDLKAAAERAALDNIRGRLPEIALMFGRPASLRDLVNGDFFVEPPVRWDGIGPPTFEPYFLTDEAVIAAIPELAACPR